MADASSLPRARYGRRLDLDRHRSGGRARLRGGDMAIALVTGTSSGIGLATAVALARVGHTVVATMRNLDGGAETRKIAAAEKLPIHLAALDVDDDASVREAFARVIAQ